jgi:HEPN domain-containing protein
MNKDDFKQIAKIRLKEAKTLLSNGNYDGAYYLCGYVVECGLKACIAKKTKRYDFPDKKTVEDSYTHEIEKLIGVAGLKQDLQNETKRNKQFEVNWTVVKDWTEVSRYERQNDKKAHDLYSAITNRQNGVLKWIRQYW